jgi:MoxR-like ATPase
VTQLLVEARLPVRSEPAPDEHVAPVQLGACCRPLELLEVAAGQEDDGGLDPLEALLLGEREPERVEAEKRDVGRVAREVASHLPLETLRDTHGRSD